MPAVEAEEARADGVEGADPERLGVITDELAEASSHLARSFIGERDGEDAIRRDAALLNEASDAVRDDARLPAPCAREDDERAELMEYGLALRWVEVR